MHPKWLMESGEDGWMDGCAQRGNLAVVVLCCDVAKKTFVFATSLA